MGLSVGLVATALSSNIPTGVLVDCCFLVSSAVFLAVRIIYGFTAFNFEGIQQFSRIFMGERDDVPQQGGWHSNAHPPWRRAWGRVEVPKAPRVGSESWEGAIAQKC